MKSPLPFVALVCLLGLTLQTSTAVAGDVETSGSIRLRQHSVLNSDFDSDQDDAQRYTEMRTRVQFTASAGEYGSVFVQLQESRVLGAGGGSVSSLNLVDLHQGYLQLSGIFDRPLDLRLGRMVLAYGGQRQLGGLEWHNVGRSFDGARAAYGFEEMGWIHLFATKLAEQNGGASNAAEMALLGAYLHLEPSEGLQLEGYLLDSYTDNGMELDAGNVYTAGARAVWKSESVELFAEGAMQFGTTAQSMPDTVLFEGSDVAAYAFVAGARYDLPGDSPIWLGAEFNLASGDDDPADDEIKTYEQLHPTGHAVLGYMDLVGWRNIQAISASVGYDPNPKWKLWSTFHVFSLVEEVDSWYGVSGAPIAAGASTRDAALGNELDVSAKFVPDGALSFEGHFTYWLPGDWQEQAAGGGLDAALTTYLLTTFKF